MSRSLVPYSGAVSNVTEEPEFPEMISDGKRMRLVWRSGDGDGDSSAHMVERTMNLLRGHPTWKIFFGDVVLPIIRGSKNEPPHYVYLDDRACYVIYCSAAYSNSELRTFWPWDFNHFGRVKQGRMNRGRPAFLDESHTELAQAPLRGKGQWYTFSGAPEVTNYKPLRPRMKTYLEEAVAQEYAEAKANKKDSKVIFELQEQNVSIPDQVRLSRALDLPANDTKELYSSRLATASSTTAQSKVETPVARTPPRQKYDAKPGTLPLRSLPGTSSGDNLRAVPHADSPLGTGGLDDFKPERLLTGTRKAKTGVPTENSTPKRCLEDPVDVESSKKRVHSSAHVKPRDDYGFSCDGAQDSEVVILDNEESSEDERLVHKAAQQHPSTMDQLEAQISQLQWDLQTTRLRLNKVNQDRDHYRTVIVLLLATKLSQRTDLTERVAAFQTLARSLETLKLDAENLVNTSKQQIEPTAALCEDISLTVLDGPGKYMYNEGLDEEWNTLQHEAMEMNKANGKNGCQPDVW